MIDNLDRILCSMQVAMNNLRSFHWNMQGAHFISFHRLLDELVGMLFKQQDEIAEWIKGLGGIPTHTLSGYLSDSAIEEIITVPEPMESMEMALYMLNAIKDIIEIQVNEGTFDKTTENMILNISQELFEKIYWLRQLVK